MDEMIVSNETKAFYVQLEDAMQQIEAIPKSGDEGLFTLISQRTEQLMRVSDQYQKSQKAAEASLERAKTIHDQEVKFGHKKQAILDVKEGLLDTSQAVYELSETQKMLQSYQTYLTKFTGKLFELSVSNIAMSDSLVQRLQILLQGDKQGIFFQ